MPMVSRSCWNETDQAAVRLQLARIFSSGYFANSPRKQRFLDYIVSETLAGRQHYLKGYVVGVAVFGRPAAFDPVSDPIVRIEAGRLRAKLTAYYQTTGRSDPIHIELPKGTYAPRIEMRRSPGSGLPRVAARDELVRGLEWHWHYTVQACAIAQRHFCRAIDLDPTYSSAHYWLARSYILNASLTSDCGYLVDAGARHARRTVELDGRSAFARSVLGWSHLFLADYDTAIREGQTACEIDPTSADARLFLSFILALSGEPERAVETIELSLRLQPNPSCFQFEAQGTANFALGNYDAAIEAFARGVELNPAYLHCQHGLAVAYGASGRVMQARSQAAVVKETWPDALVHPFGRCIVADKWLRAGALAGLH